MHRLRIFAACPSDMVAERARVATVAASLKPLADSQNIVIDVTDWSAVAPGMGRPEQVILDQRQPTDWDVFVGILWHRFGTAPNAADPVSGSRYLGGTEEEFKSAYRLWKGTGRPRIMMYRCIRAIPPKVLDAEQYTRVEQLFAEFNATEGAHPGLYHEFEQTDGLERLLLENLQHLLIEFAKRFQDTPISPGLIQALAPKVPDNLPRRAPFFGRERDLEIALRALSPDDRTWGVLVDGIGGIGKSSLAIEAAWKCKDAGLFDAFIFVSAKQDALRPEGIRAVTAAAKTLDEFLNETARVLGQAGIGQLAGRAKRDALLDALRATRALLIYDNLETLSKQEQEATAEFLRELPSGSKAIITSRRRGGEGGVWLRLDQLEWEGARAIIRNELTHDAGLASKLNAAGEARWQELYDETKGSPLALVHALGLIRTRASLTFDGALRLLRGNGLGDLQTFIFSEAQRELTENDRIALNALSFFMPSATFEAWTAVSDLSRSALEVSLDRLSALSLVDIVAGADRFALHPMTRNFVRDSLLAKPAAERDTGLRFAGHWAGYADLHGGPNDRPHEALASEWPNLRAAAGWLWETGRPLGNNATSKRVGRMLNRLAQDVSKFLLYSGRWDDLIEIASRSYELAKALEDWVEMSSRAHDITWIHIERGDLHGAEFWLGRDLDASRRSGNRWQNLKGLVLRCRLLEAQERIEEARALNQEALALARELKNDGFTASVILSTASLDDYVDDFDAAEKHFLEAAALFEKADIPSGVMSAIGRLGILNARLGRFDTAQPLLERAASIATQVGRIDWVAFMDYGFALIAEGRGDIQQARTLARRALEVLDKIGDAWRGNARELLERLKVTASLDSTAQ
jgi:tetratricopeptide (TPR) repeat protein